MNGYKYKIIKFNSLWWVCFSTYCIRFSSWKEALGFVLNVWRLRKRLKDEVEQLEGEG